MKIRIRNLLWTYFDYRGGPKNDPASYRRCVVERVA